MIVCVGIFLQLYSLKNSITLLLKHTAETQLNLVEMSYNKKMSQLAIICKSKALPQVDRKHMFCASLVSEIITYTQSLVMVNGRRYPIIQFGEVAEG